ncbi:MAG: hypothetical protein N2449_04380 [Bacteroidales bacterium]|nr:hypothetical protein [Bacteroidales bacterium]
MKALFFILISFLVLLSIFFSVKNNNEPPYYYNYSVTLNDTVSTTPFFYILNSNNKDVFLTFNFNNQFLTSYQLPRITDTTSFVKNYFNFFTNRLSHLDYLNQHHIEPLVRYNSLGVGLCGKLSKIFCFTMTYNGIPSRLLYLNGHVVCELYYQNQWHLFDIDRKTFFEQNQNILSFKQLLSDMDSITYLSANEFLLYSTQINYYKNLYSTTLDNFYDSIANVVNDSLIIQLPPKSTLEIPVYDNNSIDPLDSYHAFLRITIHDLNNKIFLQNPLVISKIEGTGRVYYNQQTYTFPDDSIRFKFDILTNYNYQEEITILQIKDSLSIYYRINPLLVKPSKFNEFDCYSSLPLIIKPTIKQITQPSIKLFEQAIIEDNNFLWLKKQLPFLPKQPIFSVYYSYISPKLSKLQIDSIGTKNRIALINELFLDNNVMYDENSYYTIWYWILFMDNDEFMRSYNFYYKYYSFLKLIHEYQSKS